MFWVAKPSPHHIEIVQNEILTLDCHGHSFPFCQVLHAGSSVLEIVLLALNSSLKYWCYTPSWNQIQTIFTFIASIGIWNKRWHQNRLIEFEKKIDWIVYTYKLKEESCSSSLSDSAKSLLAFSLRALLSSMDRGSPLSLPVSSAIPCPVLITQNCWIVWHQLVNKIEKEVWKQWASTFFSSIG